MYKIITEIYVLLDEFCKLYEQEIKHYLLANSRKRKPTRLPRLSTAEILTILVCYSFSGYKNFKLYYQQGISKKDFPNLVTYERFVQLMPRHLFIMNCCLQSLCATETNNYFIDSTCIPVCHNKRINSNKVFKGIAKIGKSTKGWFFGVKLHLIINTKGEIMNMMLTKGDKSDVSAVEQLAKCLMGKLYGDKGYISSLLFNRLFSKGLQLITSIKKNMKKKLMSVYDKVMLRKRSLIETVFDLLKNKFNLEHTRHRSPVNFIVHIISTLIAYCLRKSKPSIKFPHQQLASA